MSKPVFVTQPSLPPLEDFLPYLQKIWDNKQLTNNGQMHQQLEEQLAIYLKVPYLNLFCNGMAALQTALNCLRVSGEVITTPFTFVATSHSISLHGSTPVFCDIDPETLNIDASKIEALITDKTSAIMPVHVYGRPCDTEAIEAIARRYKLQVIYDGAHAFGIEQNGDSILTKGDLTTLSFHATKVFNTLEGGAIVSNDVETKTRIDQLKNFGILNEEQTVNIAGNGKMNEFQAAFGLMQLKSVDEQILKRQLIAQAYTQAFTNVKGLRLPTEIASVKANYGYYPILVESSFPLSRDQLYDYLKVNSVHARKYFSPLVSEFSPYRHLRSAQPDNLPIASAAAASVLCLPIFPELGRRQQLVIDLVHQVAEE
ncbi:MAG: DegT/DnrJ/EryC1/StrS family aminotransferase [Verrucomicrobiae bacterium]|nr:DegT/DnrJ/EryC1/StrS family aminotransferase [Verrucomicrobiae bacterium]NNJ43711.1 DegT/DnrJ/EryC1/StrS family aminotransferase [Akkermansiaceae bacterium]